MVALSLLAVVAFSPAQASAQIVLSTVGGGPSLPNGPFIPFGGYWGPTYPYPPRATTSPYSFGTTLGNVGPIAPVSAVSSPPANLYAPYYPNGAGASGPIIFPGFGAADSPRARPTIYPAFRLTKEKYDAAMREDNPEATKARFTIMVPVGNAKVFIDNAATTQTGRVREFETPTLSGQGTYNFTIRAQWTDERGQHNESRLVQFRPGDSKEVSFLNVD